jgi:hypothetical protein
MSHTTTGAEQGYLKAKALRMFHLGFGCSASMYRDPSEM